jgi:hypothetical protein
MSPACLEPKYLSSEDGCIYGYGMIPVTCISISTLLPVWLLTLMHVRHTIPLLYIQPSSWRGALGFETSRNHQEIKILIYEMCILLFILYNYITMFILYNYITMFILYNYITMFILYNYITMHSAKKTANKN